MLITAITNLSMGTWSSFILILWGGGGEGGTKHQRVWTVCYCPLDLMTLTDTFRGQKASITGTQTTDFLLELSDGVRTVHVGRGGDSRSMQNFIAKQSCTFLLVRVLV